MNYWATKQMRKLNPTITLNRIPAELDTLPELFRQAGYRTFGVIDNSNITAEMGFAGFDLVKVYPYKTATVVNQTVREWSAQLGHDSAHRRRPYFLYLHYMDPHDPYHERQPWAGLFRTERGAAQRGRRQEKIDNYDSEIAFVDRHVEELYRLLNWDSNTLLILTSDHGESFGEHKIWGHGQALYDQLISVPLLVRFPERFHRGAAIDQPISTVAILPTLVDLFDLRVKQRMAGQSFRGLLEAAADQPNQPPCWSHMVTKQGGEFKIIVRALISWPWKLISYSDAGTGSELRRQLFRLDSDRMEVHNLSDGEPQVAAQLSKRLQEGERRQFPGSRFSTALTHDQLKQLQTLGYVD